MDERLTNEIMGVSLHIQRVAGQEADLPSIEAAEAIQIFNSVPWKEEILAWEKMPEDQREEHRPLYQLFDDQGHILHITAYSDQLMGVAYNYPSPSSPFGMSYENEDEYLGTDQFPRAEISTLIECFFQHQTARMLSLLGRYPMKPSSEQESASP